MNPTDNGNNSSAGDNSADEFDFCEISSDEMDMKSVMKNVKKVEVI
jgi:hypothetical protein